MAKTQRKYKDTVFRLLFGNNKKELLELYNAVNDSHYENPEELQITTLENAIFLGMKNDISFLIQDVLNLYEHQSTPNPNLPLRDLFYVADVLQNLTQDMNLYSRKRQMIAVPRFLMFYNGTDDLSEVTEYRLSDLYAVKEQDPQLELVVKIININAEGRSKLLEKNRTLREYAEFVRTVRAFRKQGGPLKAAIRNAVDDCIHRNILAEFLKKQRAEVIKVSIYEFDAKKYEGWIREESREEGREEGRQEGREEGRQEGRLEGRLEGREEGDLNRLILQVQKKVRRNKELSVIVDELESDEEEIRPIYEAVLKYGPDLPPEEIRKKMEAVETV